MEVLGCGARVNEWEGLKRCLRPLVWALVGGYRQEREFGLQSRGMEIGGLVDGGGGCEAMGGRGRGERGDWG